MSGTLLDLAREMREVEAALIEAGGELTPELEPRYEAACTALVAKVDRFAEYLRVLEGQAEGLKAFEAEVARKRRVMENHRARLLNFADMALGTKDSLEGEHCAIRRRRNPGSVAVTDPHAVAAALPEVVTREVTLKVDKKALGARLRAGESVPGANLVESYRIEVK